LRCADPWKAPIFHANRSHKRVATLQIRAKR
jgi:hypothetical protein